VSVGVWFGGCNVWSLLFGKWHLQNHLILQT